MEMQKEFLVDEETLEVPFSLVKSKTGFSFDIGGSCIKLVYSLGDKNEKGDSLIIRMTSFSSTKLKEAMEFLKKRLGSVIQSGEKIFTTGVGCHIEENFINSELGIKLVNVSEMDGFVEAFRFLVSNYSVGDITHPQSSVEVEYKDRMISQILSMLAKNVSISPELRTSNGQMGVENTDSSLIENQMKKDEEAAAAAAAANESKEVAAVEEQLPPKFKYPCIMAMMGSGGGILKIEEDKFMVLDGMTRCGRMFLGLGSLLVGSKSFEELIELASKGNDENVTVLGKQLKSNEGLDVYAQMPDDLVLYCFGQAVGRNLADFKREDLAAALLSTIAQDLAQATHLNSHVLKADTIYFCGSFVGQSQLVRDTVGKYFSFRCSLDAFNQMPLKTHHFMKFGGYLGALGCLLRNMNK